jgi:hypothetical protein
VLLTLQVATGGLVIIRREWAECKVNSVLLKRRCSLEAKIWCLVKCNFVIENQVKQVFTSRDSLLGEPMFKDEYDDTKRRCQRKMKQRHKEKLSAALAEKHFNGAHRRVEALVEIQFFLLFYSIFNRFSDFVSLK